jgi:NADPH:quinone reductase-like Zn-dependent oxidoreductase
LKYGKFKIHGCVNRRADGRPGETRLQDRVMKAIRAHQKSAENGPLAVELSDIDTPRPGAGTCLVEVHGTGVNPSDVKALIGRMPNLAWPRTPGRDFAGRVVEGPPELIGREVWGTGGDLGMSRDGCHAQYVVIDRAAAREKPDALSLLEAGGVGVSFSCGWLGIVAGADVQAGETVAVLGAHGMTGQAAVQLAAAAGAKVIAVERYRDTYAGHAAAPVDVIDLRKESLRDGLMDRTGGRGADVIFNSVGSPYFEEALRSLAKKGRQIIIATFVEDVPINLRVFYRGNQRLVGVSNLDNGHAESGDIMDALRPGFEAGDLKPFPVRDDHLFTLETAAKAYALALKGETRERIYIAPQG